MFELFDIERVGWQEEYDEVLKDPYISKKYDRERRFRDHLEYIYEKAAEISDNGSGIVVDVGTGPGEFLEIARRNGYDAVGIEALEDKSLMGHEYDRLSRLMHERQQLNVKYVGFDNIYDNLPFEDDSVVFVNFRGSFEQVFESSYLDGESHIVHKDAFRLRWILDDNLVSMVKNLLEEVYRVLLAGGVLLIHFNGSANHDEFVKVFRENIDGEKFNIVIEDDRVLKIVKVS